MSENFAIVNLRGGLQRDVTPFLLNNDAFPIMQNAYLFRGRIQKRSGFSTIGKGQGRLRWQIGTTDGSGNFGPYALPDGAVEDIPTAIVEIEITDGTDTEYFTDPGGASPVAMLATASGSASLTRGFPASITITGSIASAAVWYYPGLPVMGLRTQETESINDESLIGFDTKYSYLYIEGSGNFGAANTMVDNGTAGAGNIFIWTASDSDLFWTANYYDVMWTTNNTAGYHAAVDVSLVAEGDGIRWYVSENLNPTNFGWSNFNPGVNGSTGVAATEFLLGGLIILPYKDRLIVFNTLEGSSLATSTRYPQRARWCQNGTPFYSNLPTNASGVAGGGDSLAWSSVEVGKGGYFDAPTNEQIVGAEFIKDTLIVYFERSTWQFVYTGNESFPFVWQKINTELGTESTFSVIPFDKGVFGVGNYGVITTDSVNVVRIDEKIPDEVFKFQNLNNGVKRVFGIRDYSAQLVYWTYPIKVNLTGAATTYDLKFPNQVLVYSYLDGTWAQFDDDFTCFGYWQKFSDITWEEVKKPWQSLNASWNSEVNSAKNYDVIAGNQRGYVVIYSQLDNEGINDVSLPIAAIDVSNKILTVTNHNLVINDFIYLTGIEGVTSNRDSTTPNNVVYKIINVTVDTLTLELQQVNDPPVDEVWSGTYTGLGRITVLPVIYIQTKQYNPFFSQGKSVRVNYCDLYLNRTSSGEFTAQFYTNSNNSIPLESVTVNTYPESQTPFSGAQAQIFHRAFTNSFGAFFQNVFTLSDDQMRDISIATEQITIQGLIYYVDPAGRITYDL